MTSQQRSIRLRSYDGSDEVEVAVAEPTSIESALPSWLDRLQLKSRDSEGNAFDWTVQDSHGNLVSPSANVQELAEGESYTLAPDLTPAYSL
jgi:hypothetical protein